MRLEEGRMPNHKPRYVTFQSWAGIAVRGINEFQLGRSAAVHTTSAFDGIREWDVVLSAITRPEGGSYDTVVSYDGTAVTWGFAQWTFTSGRLQRLLASIQNEAPASFNGSDIPKVLSQAGLNLAPKGTLVDAAGHTVDDKDRLRELLTPPDGVVPRIGKYYDYAVNVALAFAELGLNRTVSQIQERFLLKELESEARLSRPKLHGKSISSYLYPKFPALTDPIDTIPELTAARALIWSMWQNSPRAAEEHMYRVLGSKPFSARSDLGRLAGVFARSSHGFWGNKKCGKSRESRYHKVATVINDLIGDQLQTKLEPDLT